MLASNKLSAGRDLSNVFSLNGPVNPWVGDVGENERELERTVRREQRESLGILCKQLADLRLVLCVLAFCPPKENDKCNDPRESNGSVAVAEVLKEREKQFHRENFTIFRENVNSWVYIGYRVFNPLDVDTHLNLPTRYWDKSATVSLLRTAQHTIPVRLIKLEKWLDSNQRLALPPSVLVLHHEGVAALPTELHFLLLQWEDFNLQPPDYYSGL